MDSVNTADKLNDVHIKVSLNQNSTKLYQLNIMVGREF